MNIVASAATLGDPEPDGRVPVVEVHTDHTGQQHRREYRGPAGWSQEQADTRLTTSAQAVQGSLEQDEIARFLDALRAGRNPFRDQAGNPVNPAHQTRNAAIREVLRYVLREADPAPYRVAWGFLDNLTDGQLAAVLSVSAAKVTEIRSKHTTLKPAFAVLNAYTLVELD